MHGAKLSPFLKKKGTRTLYEFAFAKALSDCFPKKVNFKNIDYKLRLHSINVNPRLRSEANALCEAWIDEHFIQKVPTIFLESKVIFYITDMGPSNYRRISVSDGIIIIDFIIEPPVNDRLKVWHRIRREA